MAPTEGVCQQSEKQKYSSGLGLLGLALLNRIVSDMDSGTEGTLSKSAQQVKEGDSATAKCLLLNARYRVKNKQTNTKMLITNRNILGDNN